MIFIINLIAGRVMRIENRLIVIDRQTLNTFTTCNNNNNFHFRFPVIIDRSCEISR